MKKNLLTGFALVCFSAANISAQNFVRCNTHEHNQQELAADPSSQVLIDKYEQDYQDFLAANPNGYNHRALVTIPVVFHVVYMTSGQNISTTRILQQLDVLNKDYTKTNTDINLVPAAWTSIAAD